MVFIPADISILCYFIHSRNSRHLFSLVLSGAASKRRKLEEEGFNQIIDVNFDDIKPDEREWLTKALTEDDADKPGPKVRYLFTYRTHDIKGRRFKSFGPLSSNIKMT